VDGVLAHGLLMRGESARALVLLEEVLRRLDRPEQWCRWSVPLARAMAASWRTDWALEVALALDYLSESDAGTHLDALQALVQVDGARHATARQASVDQLALARRDGAALDLRAIAAVADFLGQQQRANEAVAWLQAVGSSASAEPDIAAFWLAWLELRGQALRGERVAAEDEEEAYVAASGLGPRYELAISTLVVLAELEDSRTISAALLDEVRRADELGVPAVGFRVLARAAEVAAENEATLLADRLLVEAARFARAARRPRDMASVLYELERYRLSRGRSALAGELLGPYVDVLASADLRLWLGRHSLATAQQVSDAQATRDALELALELFRSIGDGANVAITCLGLARQDASTGRLPEARAWVARARLFEGVLKDPSLTAFRQQVERELEQRERAEGDGKQP
jgi:hypothetical protein